MVQDRVSPTSLNGRNTGHLKGRIAFWTTFVLGSAAGTSLGYKMGHKMDRGVAIHRIERFRGQLRKIAEAKQDSLEQSQTSTSPKVQIIPPSVQ